MWPTDYGDWTWRVAGREKEIRGGNEGEGEGGRGAYEELPAVPGELGEHDARNEKHENNGHHDPGDQEALEVEQFLHTHTNPYTRDSLSILISTTRLPNSKSYYLVLLINIVVFW